MGRYAWGNPGGGSQGWGGASSGGGGGTYSEVIPGIPMTYSTTRNSTGIAAGEFRTDNNTMGSVTTLYVYQTDAASQDQGALLATLSAGGIIYTTDVYGNIMVWKVTGAVDSGTYYTLTATYVSGAEHAAGDIWVTYAPAMDNHPDTIEVSGAGTAAANGAYRRGEGADAYRDGFAQWVKEGDATTVIRSTNVSEIYSIDNDGTILYSAATAGVKPWESAWIAEDGSNPAPTVSAGGGKVLDPRAVVVSGAGTAACNATYLQAGVYNGRPWYAKVGGVNTGNPLTSDSSWWDGGSDTFNGWAISNAGDYCYGSNDVVSFPWMGSFQSSSPIFDPAPIVTQGYTTPQALADQLAAATYLNGYPVEFIALTDGDVLTFDGTNNKWINQAP